MKKLYKALLAGAAILAMAPSASADMWLIGQPQGWDIADGSMPLQETSSGVYEAMYNIPSGQFMFRFYTALGDWETNSIGSQEGDVNIDITLTDDVWYTSSYVNGKGNWSYPYWKGGDLYITVDTNKKTVVFTTDPNADIPAAMPDMFIRGANINGASGWDAINKMTYDYANGVYSWKGTELGSGFKFSDDPSWEGQYNIGSNGSPIQVDVPYTYYNGGDSGNIVFASNAEVISNPIVTLDVNKGTVLITGSSEEQEVTLYLAGTFNDWVGNDKDYMFTKQADGTFMGTFFLYPDSAFQVVLLGNTWYGYADGNGEISLASGSATVNLGTGYQNDMLLVDWDGGELTFTVTMDDATPKTLKIDTGMGGSGDDEPGDQPDDEGGVSTIIDDAAPRVIYNLQGLPVDANHLRPGIYIVNGHKVIL